MEHELKTLPEHYDAIERSDKTCELRLNDRNYQVGDTLHLRRYEPLIPGYTGPSLRVLVTHILSGGVWLSPGYVAMSIRLVGEDGRGGADRQRKELDAARAALQAARIYVDRMTIQVGPVAHDGVADARRVLQLIDKALEGELKR